GAQAADAIVAAEPEPMEYVRVCDAFGTGYFYIPGTETCLKISGYVRAQVDIWETTDADSDTAIDMWTRGRIVVEAKNDSELGTIGSYIAMQAEGEEDYRDSGVYLDEAYITVGGFKVGYMYNYWDNGLKGEVDSLGSNLVNAVGYEYSSDAFTAGIFVDELYESAPGEYDGVGVEAQVSATFGVATATLLGGYDFANEEGAVRLIVEAEIGPGTLGVAGIYSTGANQYYDTAEWTVAASYAAKLTDKLTLTPGAQYYWNYGLVEDDDRYEVGLTLDYALAEGLALKADIQYGDNNASADERWDSFVRLQRSF
ncbi:MAG: porin, partial [Hydrogenophaga sp.]|nr:porin [Hydrogenophaga sp.]